MKVKDLVGPFQAKFEKDHNLLTYDQYLEWVSKNTAQATRGSAQFVVDMMDYYGKVPVQLPEGGCFRFKIFENKVIGHESIQTEIYKTLQSYAQIGVNHRLILLHGPNGSAKSTLIQALMGGMEDFSHTLEGAVHTFSWVFPIDRISRGSLGIQASGPKRSEGESYALLTEEDLASVIPCELRDSPLLLLPVEIRRKFLGDAIYGQLPLRLKMGGLSSRDQRIFDALLTNYHGNLADVLRHIRVERFYLSKRYRVGLVTVEPQLHVDAAYQQLTLNKAFSALPTSLQAINLFSVGGDLVDGNRGVVDYADLLKRPLDSFKYLLGACETATVNVGPVILSLDTIFIGSSNELQLDGFKEYPDFGSFKGRIELIRVPYLLRVQEERAIYQPILPQIAGSKTIVPHVDWAIAFWATLTRLKKPNRENFPTEVRYLIDRIRPTDKLKMMDTGELPEHWPTEERLQLKPHLTKLLLEYKSVPYYEGRSGASARELKTIMVDAAQNPDFKTFSVFAIVHELRAFVQRTSEYDFLRQDPVDGYHDAAGFIEVLLDEYTAIIDAEVRESLGLYERNQWADFTKKYIVHLSTLLKKEKIKNSLTGRMEDPDLSVIHEFESITQAPSSDEAKDQYRKNLISQIGAWVLDHKNEAVDYFRIFPEIRQRLEKHYFESQKVQLQKMHSALAAYGSDSTQNTTSDGATLAARTLKNMKEKFGYPEDGAKEVIAFLLKRRYS